LFVKARTKQTNRGKATGELISGDFFVIQNK